MMFCPNCGMENADTATECRRCHVPLELQAEAAHPAAPAAEAAPPADALSGQLGEVCRRCESYNEPGALRCMTCGYPLVAAGGEAAPAGQPAGQHPEHHEGAHEHAYADEPSADHAAHAEHHEAAAPAHEHAAAQPDAGHFAEHTPATPAPAHMTTDTPPDGSPSIHVAADVYEDRHPDMASALASVQHVEHTPPDPVPALTARVAPGKPAPVSKAAIAGAAIGAGVAAVALARSSTRPAAPSAPPPAAAEPKAVGAGDKSCPQCSTVNPPAAKFCAECGTPFPKATAALTPSAPPPPAPEPEPHHEEPPAHFESEPVAADEHDANHPSTSVDDVPAELRASHDTGDDAIDSAPLSTDDFAQHDEQSPVAVEVEAEAEVVAEAEPEPEPEPVPLGQREAPFHASLVVERGTSVGTAFVLAHVENTVGGAGAAVALSDDPHLAPHAATFLFEDGDMHAATTHARAILRDEPGGEPTAEAPHTEGMRYATGEEAPPNGHRLLVRDEGSANGVYVRVRGSVRLETGDQFAAGERLLRYDGALELPAPQESEVPVLGSPRPAGAALRISEVLMGGQTGRTCHRAGPVIAVGRTGCDLNFPSDALLAARHVEVRVDEQGNALLVDLGASAEGVFVRLRPQSEYEVQPGAMVRVGAQLLKVEMG